MKKIKQFFKDRPCISINCIEKTAKLPRGTLSFAVNDKRELNENHLKKLIPVLKKYGYQE
jgi:chromosome partitioning protein